MPQFFERRDVFGNSPAVWILAALLFAAPLGWWSLSHLERREDVGFWLMPADPVRQTAEWAAESFPIQTDLLVTWTGSSIDDPRITAFRHRLEPARDEQGVLRGGIPQIAAISDPRDLLRHMLDHEVPAAEAVQRLTGTGLGRGPLCVRLNEDGRKKIRRLQAELPEAARKQLGIDLRIVTGDTTASSAAMGIPGEAPEPLNIDPVMMTTDGSLQKSSDQTYDLQLLWSGLPDAALIDWLHQFHPDGEVGETTLIADLFFIPGSPVALDVTFSEAGRADRKETLQRMRDAAVAVGIPLAELKMVGPAIVEVDLAAATQRAGWNPVFPWQKVHRRSALLTSIIAALLMTILVLRELRLIVIAVAATAASVFATLALMPVAGADWTAFLFVTPVFIGAITLVGTIHFARRWQSSQALDDDGAVMDANRRTFAAGMISTGMVLASVLTWSVSTLSPLRDWSEATSVALIVAFLIVHFGVPAVMLLWRGRTVASIDDPSLWHAVGSLWTRHPWGQAAAAFVVLIAASAGLRFVHLQIDMAHGLPAQSSTRQSLDMVESQLAGTVAAEALIRFDAQSQDEHDALDRMELVRAVETQLRAHPAVSGCVSWADFYPITAVMDEDASRLETNRRARLAQSSLDDWRDDPTAGQFFTVAKADRDADMDGDRGYSRRGDEFWRIATRVRWSHANDLAQTQRELDGLIQGVLKAAPGTRHRITGPLAMQVHTERLALRTFLIAAGITAGIILLTLVVSLQNFGATLLALAPCLAPSTAVLGVWSLLGGRLDLAAMMAAVVSMGLAAGQVLPLLLSFRKELATGKSRTDAIAAMLGQAGPQAWRSAWIIGLTLLPLATCDAAIVGHFALMLPMMLATAVVLQLMWLPQLLAGPLGLCFATTLVPFPEQSVIAERALPAAKNRAA
ncbi:MAG: MMPL family transporter [Planctomycetaceae bacterium]|nr:MMPL family transporter [Planctomycetaceae bacterium]